MKVPFHWYLTKLLIRSQLTICLVYIVSDQSSIPELSTIFIMKSLKNLIFCLLKCSNLSCIFSQAILGPKSILAVCSMFSQSLNSEMKLFCKVCKKPHMSFWIFEPWVTFYNLAMFFSLSHDCWRNNVDDFHDFKPRHIKH